MAAAGGCALAASDGVSGRAEQACCCDGAFVCAALVTAWR